MISSIGLHWSHFEAQRDSAYGHAIVSKLKEQQVSDLSINDQMADIKAHFRSSNLIEGEIISRINK